MNLPLVTIVTPSYNQAQFLRATIESVLNQNYPALEYWVIDGGSTDGSVDILREYSGRLNWISEPDNGQTDAINKGFQRSSGQILMYINSDDVMLPGAIWKVVNTFTEHPEALWLTGEYRIIDENGRQRESFIALYKRIQRSCMALWPSLQSVLLSLNNPIAQPSTWWRREAWEAVGQFTETLRYTMDYEYWWRLLELMPVLVVPYTLSAFRVHGASKGGTAYHQQMREQLEVAQRRGVSSMLLALQKLHNRGILFIYQFLR